MTPQTYRACANAMLKLSEPALSSAELFERVKKTVPKGVTVIWDPANEALQHYGGVYGPGGFISKVLKTELPKGEVILVSRQDPVLLAHEVGHAEFNKSTLGKVMQHRWVRGRSDLYSGNIGAGVVGAVAGAKLGPLGGALVGATVPTLLHSPVLIGEAIASSKGVARLREAGMSEEDLVKAKKQLVKYWSSYAAKSTGSGVLGGIVGIAAGAARRRP